MTQQFTGERLIPDQVEVDLWNEHFSRYALAALYCRGKRVLDAGCGAGYGAAHLAQSAESVTAIDISVEAVEQARRRYPVANLRFEIGSVTSIPFPNASFEVVTSFEVIEHLEDWRSLLTEAGRVLAPDGVALISTPNRDYYTESRGSAGPNPFHVHEFAASEFEDAVRAVFPHATILLQNRTEAIAFYPHRVFAEPAASLERSEGSPDTAHFFVAVCGFSPEAVRPRPFVFVPRAANVLREREQHIASLETQLSDAKAELEKLLEAHRGLNEHLAEQNRWALGMETELMRARERIVQLQNEFKAHQEKAQRALDEYDRRVVHAERVISMARQSRWVRMGRKVGLGPDLPA